MTTSNRTETPFTLVASDGKHIPGIMHTPPQAAKVAVVLVHGLTGSMSEYMHMMLAKLLSRAGFAVFRFDQYGYEESQRKFHTSTLSLHVSDTKAVVEYVRSLGFERVVLAGHSLGSPIAIDAADQEIAGLMLLDPSGDPKEQIKEWQTQDPRQGLSYLDWRVRIVLGDAWIEDAKAFRDPYERFSQLSCPVLLVAAERADQMKFCERYRAARLLTPETLVIADATHCFIEEGAAEALSAAMEKWITDNVA
jgi:pimeloyl-ACP methyl ester carboxylesterase